MKRSKFSLSHYKLLSCDMGELIPCGLREVLPGDTFQHSTSLLVRVSPLLAPVMHPVEVRVHHWFVPFRLIWDDWEKFITGGPDGADASVMPTIPWTRFPPDNMVSVGSLADYLGLPVSMDMFGSSEISALPFRAYDLIWNEAYRDQDLQTPLVISTASGNDTTSNIDLQNVCWEKDYFTSARDEPQKGPAVTLPLGVRAPVLGIGKGNSGAGDFPLTNQNARESDGTSSTYPFASNINPAAADSDYLVKGTAATNGYPDIYTDLSAATAATVDDLREAMALQRFEEARLRYGSRYTEYLRYLGIRSSDARLQRPEYLGGGKQVIQFSEVLQTGPDGEDAGVATLRGHGIGALRSNKYRRFFEEHGYVVSLLSVKPKTMYMQGIERSWLRRIKEDFWQKELQHIGQQEVYKEEIYGNAGGTPRETWGYQDRYDEYRRAVSGVAGEFRTTLNFWHMARDFSSPPSLNASFVKSVPTKRINADQTSDVLWVMAKHSIQARRMVAKKGTSFIY